MDRGFGLQFLNGVGETYGTPVIPCPDYENREAVKIEYGGSVIRSDHFIENGGNVSASSSNSADTSVCACGRRKNLIPFLCGCLAGIAFMVLFGKEDKQKKKGKEDE